MVVGYKTPDANGNPRVGTAVVATCQDFTELASTLSGIQEIDWVPGRVTEHHYKFSNVPNYESVFANSDTIPKNFSQLDHLQQALVILAYGEQPLTASSYLNFSVRYHWEVVPISATAMTQAPSRSAFDPMALADAVNRMNSRDAGTPVDRNVWSVGFRKAA
jgi:hypothetical protein